jgi:starvation-inducible outer membrane lipoprotein
MSNGSAFLFITTTVLIISGCTSLPGAVTQTYKSEAEMLSDHKKAIKQKTNSFSC